MPVSPTYTCESCGASSKKKVIPRVGPTDSETPRCLICNIALCLRCFQHGFCHSHWARLPEKLHEPLEKIHHDVEVRRKRGICCLILVAPVIIVYLYLLIAWGINDPFMQVFLTILFFASIVFGSTYYTVGDFPIQNLRKRETKFLTPYRASMNIGQGLNAQVPSASSVPAVLGDVPRKCSNCGAYTPKGSDFCKNCGANLQE